MNDITFKIDYFSVTIWGSHEEVLKIFQDFLGETVGDPVHMGHGHRGYKWWGKALSGVNVYSMPVNETQQHGHIELKGTGCEVVGMETIKQLAQYLAERFKETGKKYKVTRLDLAWDGVNATPQEFLEAVQNDYIRSLAKRDSWDLQSSPIREGDDIRITNTVYFGSRTSERRLRVYDMHGFTRVELQTRDERAQAIVEVLFNHMAEDWGNQAIGHLRDFVDVYQDESKTELAGWCAELLGAI